MPEKIGFLRLTHNDVLGGSTVEEVGEDLYEYSLMPRTDAQKAVVIVNSGMALKKLNPSKCI